MKNIRLIFISLFVMTVSGCAWQRIPDDPKYIQEATIPVKIGVIFADNRPTSLYGPAVIKEWDKMKLFDSIISPYREGDPVDALVKMDIKGGWKGSGGGAGFVIGLTLGLASSVVGPSMTGIHDAQATIQKSSSEIGNYSAKVETTVEWGMGANSSEVSKKAEELQTKRIAHELAKKIRDDQKIILSRIGK